MTKIRGLCLGLAGAAALMVAPPAFAKTLKIAHFLPPTHWIATKIMEPWAKRVTKATNGSLKFQFYPSGQLGKPVQHYELVEKGIADVIWYPMGYKTGRYPAVDVAESWLLYKSKSAAVNSRILQRYLDKHGRSELNTVHLLFGHTQPPGSLHTTKKRIQTVSDIKGLKIRSSNVWNSRVLRLVGGAPVNIPLTEAYNALSRGTVDAITISLESVISFKLEKVVKHHLEDPLYGGVFAMLMNKKTYAGLTAAEKAAVDKSSGVYAAEAAGKVWDTLQAKYRKVLNKENGHAYSSLKPGEIKLLAKANDAVLADWAKEMRKRGKNPDVILADFRKFVANETK